MFQWRLRNAQSYQNLAIALGMPWQGADADRWPVINLRKQHLLYQTFRVELGRHEWPQIYPAAKYDDRICVCDWVRHNPKVGCITKDSLPLDPDTGT